MADEEAPPPPAEEAAPAEAPAAAEAPAEAPPEAAPEGGGAEAAPAEGAEAPAEGAPEGPAAEGAEEAVSSTTEGPEGGAEKPSSTDLSKTGSQMAPTASAMAMPEAKGSSIDTIGVKIASSSISAVRSSAMVLEEQRRARLDKYSSRAKFALGSVIDIRRGSVMGDVLDRKAPRYMNSYKLDSDNPFNPEKVDQILQTVLIEALQDLTYDADKCPKQAKWASSAIRAKVKELEFDRYKLICLVTIGEKHSQDVLVACRFLWDSDRDRYAYFSMENTFVFGIAQCFGLYYE